MTATDKQLWNLRRLNALVFGVMILLGVAYEDDQVLVGLAVGGLTSLVNLELMVRIHRGLLAPGSNPGALAAKVMLKFTGLLLLVGVMLIKLPLNPIAFAVGFSVTFVSMGIGGVLLGFGSTSTDPGNSNA